MQAMPATTRAPRATLHRELRHPPALNVPRDSLNLRTPCERAHVKPLYRTRPILGLKQTERNGKQTLS